MNTPKKESVENKQVKHEEKKKGQKIKVLVSIFRYGEKIVSSLGIPSKDAWVSHKFVKDNLKAEELFNMSESLSNDDPFRKDPSYKPSIEHILSKSFKEVALPSKRANELKSIGNFHHEIIGLEIELYVSSTSDRQIKMTT